MSSKGIQTKTEKYFWGRAFSLLLIWVPTIPCLAETIDFPGPVPKIASKGKAQWAVFTKDTESFQPWPTASNRVALLPLYAQKYSESIVCDSCSRLSENGVEFFLENGLRLFLEKKVGASIAFQVAPQDGLIQSGKFLLEPFCRKPGLPDSAWFGSEGEEIIWRPRDFQSSKKLRANLDQLAGLNGVDEIWLVDDYRVQVNSKGSSLHYGSWKYEFIWAAYFPRQGSFRWAMRMKVDLWGDLNGDPEPELLKILESEFNSLNLRLQGHQHSEPH